MNPKYKPFVESILAIHAYFSSIVVVVFVTMYGMEVLKQTTLIHRPMGTLAYSIAVSSFGYLVAFVISAVLYFTLAKMTRLKGLFPRLQEVLGANPKSFPLFTIAVVSSICSVLETVIVLSPFVGLSITVGLLIISRILVNRK